MHDCIELGRELLVNRSNRALDGARQSAVEGDRARKGLLHERLYELLGAVRLGLPSSGDDLLKQAGAFRRYGAGFGSDPGFGNGLALLLFEPELTGEGF